MKEKILEVENEKAFSTIEKHLRNKIKSIDRKMMTSKSISLSYEKGWCIEELKNLKERIKYWVPRKDEKKGVYYERVPIPVENEVQKRS